MACDLTLLDGAVPTVLQGTGSPLEPGQRVGHARALRPLLLNVSASVPRGLYVLIPLTTVTRGMLVVFPPPPAVAALLVRRGYLAPHTPLLKPVAALPGETVCVQDNGVVIQGVFVAPVASV